MEMGLWICRLVPLVQQCFSGEGLADCFPMFVENIHSFVKSLKCYGCVSRQSGAFVITKPYRAPLFGNYL